MLWFSARLSNFQLWHGVDLFYLLRVFSLSLGNGHVSGVQPIMTARVPILKVIDTGTRIECDISVENRDGILKSQIIQIISSIDERFQKLCFLVIWPKKLLFMLAICSFLRFTFITRKPWLHTSLTVWHLGCSDW